MKFIIFICNVFPFAHCDQPHIHLHALLYYSKHFLWSVLLIICSYEIKNNKNNKMAIWFYVSGHNDKVLNLGKYNLR